MKPKRENNKYDIVLEAEAVLQAYADRCKIYVKQSEKRRKSKWKSALGCLALCLMSLLFFLCLRYVF